MSWYAPASSTSRRSATALRLDVACEHRQGTVTDTVVHPAGRTGNQSSEGIVAAITATVHVKPVHRRNLDKQRVAIGINPVRSIGNVLDVRWCEIAVPELISRAPDQYPNVVAAESAQSTGQGVHGRGDLGGLLHAVLATSSLPPRSGCLTLKDQDSHLGTQLPLTELSKRLRQLDTALGSVIDDHERWLYGL